MTLSPTGLMRSFWKRIKPYPNWLRILLAPMGLLLLLVWPVHAVISTPFLILRTIWVGLQKYPPFRQIAALFDLELWREPQREIPHPYDMLARSRLTRRVLAPVLLVEWISLIGIGISGGLLCLLSDPSPFLESICGIAFMVMLVAGMPAWALYSYHGSLLVRWKQLNAPLCPHCGYNRIHPASSRCPECGSLSAPVAPGKPPREWKRWSPVIHESAVFLPFALVWMLWLLTSLITTWATWIPLWMIGGFLLALTASVVAMTGIAASQVLFAKR
jgi:hypothetical protein